MIPEQCLSESNSNSTTIIIPYLYLLYLYLLEKPLLYRFFQGNSYYTSHNIHGPLADAICDRLFAKAIDIELKENSFDESF